MKKILLISCLLFISFSAFSQIVYLADTAFTTDVGYNGAPASCRAIHERYVGWDMNRAQNQWLADMFTVPMDATWKFDTVIVYGIQFNSGLTSTFLDCNLQIYDGPPGLGGSVIWGDTVANVMVSTGFTGIYKVDTISNNGGLTSNTRPIMYLKLYLSPAPVLTSGSYWLSWSSAVSGSNVPYSPNKVLPDRTNPPGQVGRGLYNGNWSYLTDSGNTIGFNMIIKASAAAASIPEINSQAGVLLNQNVPNPFANNTNISFNIGHSSYTHLSIYNTMGQLVATPVDGYMEAGTHRVTFDADKLPAGVYYYQLQTDAGSDSKQMIVVK